MSDANVNAEQSADVKVKHNNFLKFILQHNKMLQSKIEALKFLVMFLSGQGQYAKALLTLSAINFYLKQLQKIVDCSDVSKLFSEQELTAELITERESQRGKSFAQLCSPLIYEQLILQVDSTQKYLRYARIVVLYLQDDYEKALEYIKKFEETYKEDFTQEKDLDSKQQPELTQSNQDNNVKLYNFFKLQTFQFIKRRCEYVLALSI